MTTATDTPLAVGTKAPEFDLPASRAEGNIKLSDFAGKNLILVFYPKDKTPGCTKQLCALQSDRSMFTDLNTEVIASNPGSQDSHNSFSDKEGYEFPILVDAERTMARDYQVLKEDDKGIQRTVYIIDGEGVIRFAERGMPSDEQLADVIRNF